MKFDIITCTDINRGIGKGGTIPWNEPEDIKRFKQITTTASKNKINAIVMGRKTYESIGKPLSNRLNVIISSTLKDVQDCYVFDNFNKALNFLDEKLEVENCFIIGGAQLYELVLSDPRLRFVYITRLHKDYDCDVYFPVVSYSKYTILETYADEHYTFEKLSIVNNEEEHFLNIMCNILSSNYKSVDRTQVGTYSLFGQHLRFDLRHSFPLMTTRKLFLRPILEEFKFIMSGSTDVNKLREKNVHIWDANTTRQFLDINGLTHLPEYDMGPTYGFLVRHFGATYVDCKTDYTNQGYDQLQDVYNLIKNNPSSRRIRISQWDPSNLDKSPLPSCLCQFDFFVNTNEKTLSLCVFLRSSDTFLALMWNVAYSAIFCMVMAKLTGYTPGDLVVNTCNSHIYLNHVDQVKEQLIRTPYPFPTAKLLKNIKTIDDIQTLEVNDFNIKSYVSHPKLTGEMAI